MHKVVLVASWYPGPASAVSGTFIQEQASTLARVYDVAVIAPYGAPWSGRLRHRQSQELRLEPEGPVTVVRPAWSAPFPRCPWPWTLAGYSAAIEQALRLLGGVWGVPDIMHAHVTIPGGYAAVRCARRLGIPLVLTEHSSRYEMHLGTTALRWGARRTLRVCDAIIAVSPALAQEMVKFEPGIDPVVVWELVLSEYFTPTPPAAAQGRPFRILCVALLGAQKGIKYLLDAAKMLVERGNRDFELVIGGDGPARSDLEQQATAQGLAERCRFLGMLTREQVRDEMRACDVFVLPSLHESFGIVNAEAMCCGKPVLSTICGGPEFVVNEETGILVPPGDAAALAQALEGFLNGRYQFDTQRVRQSAVERFGESAFLRRISAVYDQAWQKHPSA